MKPARIIVLLIAVVAGGVAAFLAGRSDESQPVQQVATLETVDVLVSGGEIGLGQTVSTQDLRWQTWPPQPRRATSSARPIAPMRLSRSLARSRVSRSSGEPVREAKLIRAKGSGYMAAILLRACARSRLKSRRRPGQGPSSCRTIMSTSFSRAATARPKRPGASRLTSARPSSPMCACWRSISVEEKNGQRVVVGKTATLELSPRQTEELGRSRQMGTLSLALRSLADSSGGAQLMSDDGDTGQRSSGINMVRFGVTTMTTPR